MLVLAEVYGYSYEEIAARLDCCVGTVRSRLHRGRERMRAVYAPAGTGTFDSA